MIKVACKRCGHRWELRRSVYYNIVCRKCGINARTLSKAIERFVFYINDKILSKEEVGKYIKFKRDIEKEEEMKVKEEEEDVFELLFDARVKLLKAAGRFVSMLMFKEAAIMLYLVHIIDLLSYRRKSAD